MTATKTKDMTEISSRKGAKSRKLERIRENEGEDLISMLPEGDMFPDQIQNIHIFDEYFKEEGKPCRGERVVIIEVSCSETRWYTQILTLALLLNTDKFILLGGCDNGNTNVERFSNFNLEVIWIDPAKEGEDQLRILESLKRCTFWEDMKEFLCISGYTS